MIIMPGMYIGSSRISTVNNKMKLLAFLMSLAVVVNGYRNSYDCTDHCVYMYEHYDRSFCGSALMTECFNRCICELN